MVIQPQYKLKLKFLFFSFKFFFFKPYDVRFFSQVNLREKGSFAWTQIAAIVGKYWSKEKVFKISTVFNKMLLVSLKNNLYK